MQRDPSTIQLPPPGAQLRLPPPNLRELDYEGKYQQLRKHLKDEGNDASMSVQMKTQVSILHAEAVRAGAAD